MGEIYGDIYAQRYAIPVARFSAEPLSGTVPLTVTFSNQSLPTVGVGGFEWAFGDGITDTVTHPVHVYDTTGVYTVALTVRVVTETDTLTRTGYITVTGGGPAAPLADFSAEPLSGTVPLTVTFTNQSSGEATGYLWAFGDGMTDTITHLVHVYTTPGVYTVSLTATGPGGSDTLTRTNYVTATAPPAVETRVITYTYDPLYRLSGAEYSTGEFFQYTYDAVGNVTLASEHITTTRTTTYTYNAASQLVTSTVSGESTVWWYTYDANGNLTHQTPGGTEPAEGETRYTWDVLNRLVKVERYAGGSYEPLAEAAYDGSLPLRAKRVGDDVHVGQRTRLTMWVAGQPLTTTYTADPLKPGRVLVAADGTTTRRYLYGQGPIGECDGQWSYYLKDGQGSLRQVADAGARSPWCVLTSPAEPSWRSRERVECTRRWCSGGRGPTAPPPWWMSPRPPSTWTPSPNRAPTPTPLWSAWTCPPKARPEQSRRVPTDTFTVAWNSSDQGSSAAMHDLEVSEDGDWSIRPEALA